MIGCKLFKKKDGTVFLYEIYKDRVNLYIGNKLDKSEEYIGSYNKKIKEMTDDEEIKKLLDIYCG